MPHIPQEKEQSEHNGIFRVIKKDFFSIPVSIRIVSFSLFVFVLGRGFGADVFFSIYIKDIVDKVFWVSIVGAILSLGKMVFSIPVGDIDDHANMKSVLFLSKGAYVITGILYFIAGMLKSPPVLILAVILNGFATAALLTTYQAFIRKHTKKHTRGIAFGMYFSSINLAFVIGALVAAVIVNYLSIPYMFLFISCFAILSFFIDKRLPSLSKYKIKEFLGKDNFLHKFLIEVFSLSAIKNVLTTMKKYSNKMYYALGFEFIFNVLSYIGFIFIPIVSIDNNLSLSEIAIIFAVMRVPYVMNFFTGNIADKMSKKIFLLFALLFISFLYMLLGYNGGFRSIMTITFAISLGLSLMRPVISAFISDYTNPKDEGAISGVGEFVSRLGEAVGILLFGAFSILFGIETSFILVGIIIFVLASIGLIKKLNIFQGR